MAKPDAKAEAWASKNDWFGQDQTMTYAAFGIHRQLIEDEGFDPTSDEYYTELIVESGQSFHRSLEALRIKDPESLLLSPRLPSRLQKRGAEQSS